MEEDRWIEVDGAIVCERGLFRMVVKKVNGFLRFMVFRRGSVATAPQELLGSGTAENPRSAMHLAQRMARQFD